VLNFGITLLINLNLDLD